MEARIKKKRKEHENFQENFYKGFLNSSLALLLSLDDLARAPDSDHRYQKIDGLDGLHGHDVK